MDFVTAKHAVDLLLRAPGKDKLLSIYGGEPLLNFRLLEEICPYAHLTAARLGKNLTISICTNCTVLEKKHLLFFRKYSIRLIVSLAGNRDDHDRFRRFNSVKGSYSSVERRLHMIFDLLPRGHIGTSFCVFPSAIDNMPDNFAYLLKLGFNYVNLEIIREYEKWNRKKLERYALGLRAIVKFVFSQIPEGNFIFLNPINWQVKYRLLTRFSFGSCPFSYKLEVYPKGEMAFSPFLFNAKEKEEFLIGNVNDAALRRYAQCRFNAAILRCKRCERDYFRDYAFDEGASRAYNLYQRVCLEAAKLIENYARSKSVFKRYVRHIDKICF